MNIISSTSVLTLTKYEVIACYLEGSELGDEEPNKEESLNSVSQQLPGSVPLTLQIPCCYFPYPTPHLTPVRMFSIC
jgi:hypothetical protein